MAEGIIAQDEEFLSISCCRKYDDDYNDALPWYHGKISRDKSVKLLQLDHNGLFLVRDCEKNPKYFILCVKFRSKVHEYPIMRKPDGRLTLDEEEVFESLEELIDRYKFRRKYICWPLTNYVVKLKNIDYIKSKSIVIGKKVQSDFGTIIEGTFYGKEICLKPVQDVDMAKTLLRKAVCHENLVNLIGLTKMQDEYYLVSSTTPNGTLLEMVRAWDDNTPILTLAYNFAYDICAGMEYLEKKCISHQYVSARNVCIARNGIGKLANFGLFEEYVNNFRQLPYRHLAPEVILYKNHSVSGDMWSFGVTLWEMFTFGAVPYTDFMFNKILKNLRQGERLPQPEKCPEEIYLLMKQCWQWKPYFRPRFNDLKERFLNLRNDLRFQCKN